MRPRTIAIRWISMVAAGFTAAIILAVLEPLVQPRLQVWAESLSARGSLLLVSVFLITVAAAFMTGRGRWSGWLGAKCFLGYPPLWLAVLVGLACLGTIYGWAATSNSVDDATAGLLAVLTGMPRHGWLLLITLGLAVATAWFFALACTQNPNRKLPIATLREVASGGSEGNQRADLADFDTLVDWVNDGDRPISDPNLDGFGHKQVASRIADRLCGNAMNEQQDDCPTMALVGPFGSGKTSILNLTRYHLRERGRLGKNIALLQISLWQYDSPAAVVLGILRTLVSGVGRYVHTLGLTGLPSEYVRAIERTGGSLGGVARLLRGPSQPVEILRRIESIAIAIDVRFVLWIEDMDRFSGAGGLDPTAAALRDIERLGPVRSLLYLLDQCSRVSVVISDSSIQSRFDLEKIARFVEHPPRVEVMFAWRRISTLRTGCLDPRRWPIIDPASKKIRGQLTAPDDERHFAMWVYGAKDVKPRAQESLALVLNTPRSLKSALRLCYATWDRLRGEVDFDDTLVMSALRIA